MVVGFVPGFVVPAIIGLVGKETRKDWLIIFSITAVVIFLSIGFFIFSIRPKIQEFDEIALKREKFRLERLEKKHDEEETDMEPPKGFMDYFTPAAAQEYAERVWPDGLQNIRMSIWDKAKHAEITKICQRVEGELSGNGNDLVLSDSKGEKSFSTLL